MKTNQLTTPFHRRPYQRQIFKHLEHAGLLALLWRRQGGKTTTLAEIALLKMLRRPGRLITFASVSILLGREIVLKETQTLFTALEHLRQQAQNQHCQLQLHDAKSSRPLNTQPSTLNDQFVDLFQSQRLELRLYHSRTTYSRTLVIAPNPATARGWTGDVILDEIGFIDDLPSLWEAMEPIVSSDPDFRVTMATTYPENEAHFAYDLLVPAAPTTFPPNPLGHWYKSSAGILVHRCNIYDAHAAGCSIYDLTTRRLITPQQHCAAAINKESWRRNYALEITGGTSGALSIAAISRAQELGVNKGLCLTIDTPEDLETALAFLRKTLTNDHEDDDDDDDDYKRQSRPRYYGTYGVGWDPATTEKNTSNPSALAVVEKSGQQFIVRLVLLWKTADPRKSKDYLWDVLCCLSHRGKVTQISIDATNERYFATSMAQFLRDNHYYSALVVGSETARVPGERQPVNMKAYLGHRLIEIIEDGRMPLPPEPYIKDDFRLVKKHKGSFTADTSPTGMHGDTFDAIKLAYYAVAYSKGPIAMVG
jgi:hypothetical protein